MQEKSSQNVKKILLRLKEQLRTRTDIELSKILDVRSSTISTWKKRNSLDYSLILSICKLYKIDLNLLFFGEKKEKAKEFPNKIPLIGREAIHKYILGDFDDCISDLPHYSLPFISDDRTFRIFQITSTNMFPVLEENAFAVCEKKHLDDLNPTDIVVLISRKKGFFISYLKESRDGNFLLLSENPIFNEKPIKIKRSHIDETWVVRGKINYNLQKDLQPKLQNLENLASSSGY